MRLLVAPSRSLRSRISLPYTCPVTLTLIGAGAKSKALDGLMIGPIPLSSDEILGILTLICEGVPAPKLTFLSDALNACDSIAPNLSTSAAMIPLSLLSGDITSGSVRALGLSPTIASWGPNARPPRASLGTLDLNNDDTRATPDTASPIPSNKLPFELFNADTIAVANASDSAALTMDRAASRANLPRSLNATPPVNNSAAIAPNACADASPIPVSTVPTCPRDSMSFFVSSLDPWMLLVRGDKASVLVSDVSSGVFPSLRSRCTSPSDGILGNVMDLDRESSASDLACSISFS